MNVRKVKVTLYTRPGCHLCDVAREQMEAAGCKDLYFLEEVDIDKDPALVSLYGQRIPVISINGKEIFEFRVNAKKFKETVLSEIP